MFLFDFIFKRSTVSFISFCCSNHKYFFYYGSTAKILMSNLNIQCVFLGNLIFKLLNHFILSSSMLIKLIQHFYVLMQHQDAIFNM
ncbi:putative protein TIC214 [Helianthus anomalus]